MVFIWVWTLRLRFSIRDYALSKFQYQTSSEALCQFFDWGTIHSSYFCSCLPSFGPTYPETYDKDIGVSTLFYLGLSFAFPIPISSQHTDFCHDREELSLEFPDGTIPVTCCVSIYDGSAGEKVGVGSLMDKASAPPYLLAACTWNKCMPSLGKNCSSLLEASTFLLVHRLRMSGVN